MYITQQTSRVIESAVTSESAEKGPHNVVSRNDGRCVASGQSQVEKVDLQNIQRAAKVKNACAVAEAYTGRKTEMTGNSHCSPAATRRSLGSSKPSKAEG